MIGEYIELTNSVRSRTSVGIEGVELSFKKDFVPYNAVVVSHNNCTCNINGKIAKSNYETEIEVENQKFLIKSLGQSNTIETVKKVGEFFKKAIDGSIKEAANDFLPKIYDMNNNLVGECEYGDDNILHIVYKLFGKTFHAYVSSSEKHEYVYCIYKDDQLVAEICKNSKVHHGHARYTIYANKDCYKEVLLIAACWSLDFTKQDGEAGSMGSTYYNSPAFKEKYDRSFIDNIIQIEGESNLPDNMPLVNEYVQKAKKSTDVKIFYFGFIILIIIVLFLFLFVFNK